MLVANRPGMIAPKNSHDPNSQTEREQAEQYQTDGSFVYNHASPLKQRVHLLNLACFPAG